MQTCEKCVSIFGPLDAEDAASVSFDNLFQPAELVAVNVQFSYKII